MLKNTLTSLILKIKTNKLVVLLLLVIGALSFLTLSSYTHNTSQTYTSHAATVVQSQTYNVTLSSDIANQQGNNIRLGGTASKDRAINSNENWIGNYTSSPSYLGIRFSGSAIPKGALVTKAALQITSSRNDSENLNLQIFTENNPSPQTFSTLNGPASRALSSTQANFNKSISMKLNYSYSFDATAPVNEFIQKYGSTGQIVLIVKGTRKAYDWQRFYNTLNTTAAPRLAITYEIPVTSGETPTSAMPTTTAYPTTPTPLVTSTIPTPTPTQPVTNGAWWKPTSSAPISWNWVIGNIPSTPYAQVQMYDIDGFDNTASTVAALHAQNTKVVCYLSLGTYEPNRPDTNLIPVADIGNGVQGWPGEKWLNIADISGLTPFVKSRMQMCKDKGFDAIEPDNIDGYTNNSGFPLTAAHQLAYNKFLAETAHSMGLSIGLKNDIDQAQQLEPYFDWALNEQCNKYSECNTLLPFTQANKAVFNAEYTSDNQTTAKFCPADQAAHINGVLYNLNLNGSTYQPCTGSW